MQALLIVAHGSRRASSNDEVRALAERLRGKLGGEYPMVEAAFLELAEPLIPEGIVRCAEQGAERVTVVPYFLAAGRHVVEDIPAEIAKAKAQLPQLEVRLAQHIGASSMVDALISDAARCVADGVD